MNCRLNKEENRIGRGHFLSEFFCWFLLVVRIGLFVGLSLEFSCSQLELFSLEEKARDCYSYPSRSPKSFPFGIDFGLRMSESDQHFLVRECFPFPLGIETFHGLVFRSVTESKEEKEYS